MSQIDKQAIITEFKRHDADSGSSEVQIAILSKKITHLSEHLKTNKKDHSSRFGLIKMVNKRRKLLDYLKRTDNAKYLSLLKELNIRR